MRADLLELADVVVLSVSAAAISGQSLGDAVAAHVQSSPVPCGAKSHLCRLGAVVVAVEVGVLEVEVREGVRAVDDDRDAVLAAEVARCAATGRTWPVRLIDVARSGSCFVRAVIAASKRRTSSSMLVGGHGDGAAPDDDAVAPRALARTS